jgi:hypothetical protein
MSSFRAVAIAATFALCSGVADANTLDISFNVTQVDGAVTAATLDLDSSVVANLSAFTGTLTSSTSGDLDNGGSDSNIVTQGSDGTAFDLVDSHVNGNSFNPLVVTTIVFNSGVVTSINLSGQINGSGGGSGNGITALASGTNNEVVAKSAFGATDADLFLPVAATPLPGTLPLFAGGLGFVVYLAKRRKKNAMPALAAA